MTLGEKLKELRKQHKISVTRLATESGVHPVTIRNYECSRFLPSLINLQKICNAMGISLDSFTDCAMTVKDKKPPRDDPPNFSVCVTRQRP